MRVLVAGCGSGDLAFLAAQFVGTRGAVTGIDESDIAISAASDRARSMDIDNVTFEQQSIEQFEDGQFDAVLGRFLLMHESDPVATIWRLASLVRDGGILAIQEFDLTQPAVVRPELKLAVDSARWITLALGELGFDVGIGMRLHQSFLSSGLARPSMIVGAAVESGSDGDVCALLAEGVRDLLDVICERGISTRDEIDIDTLAARMHQAALETEAVIVSPLVVSAWSRVVRRPTGLVRPVRA